MLLLAGVLVLADASPFFFNFGSLIPQTRLGRGRSGRTGLAADEDSSESSGPAIRVESNASEDTNILKSLIESVLKVEKEEPEVLVEQDYDELPLPSIPVPVVPNSPIIKVSSKYFCQLNFLIRVSCLCPRFCLKKI